MKPPAASTARTVGGSGGGGSGGGGGGGGGGSGGGGAGRQRVRRGKVPRPVRLSRRAALRMLAAMERTPDAHRDPVQDFLSSGRTGRRNAMPDILGEHANTSTAELPARLQQLTTDPSDPAAAATAESGGGDAAAAAAAAAAAGAPQGSVGGAPTASS